MVQASGGFEEWCCRAFLLTSHLQIFMCGSGLFGLVTCLSVSTLFGKSGMHLGNVFKRGTLGLKDEVKLNIKHANTLSPQVYQQDDT